MRGASMNDVNPYGAQAQDALRLRHRPFRRARHARGLPEAHELVDDGLITERDFRDFVFTNPVEFWGGMNPNFFKGTRVEKEAAAILAEAAD